MNIIRATILDVPRILECAREFCSIIPNCPLDELHYASEWERFITDHTGAIFLMEHDGVVCGGIGGVAHPNLLTGKKIAVELFWYVKPEYRVGTWPIRLLREFESWACLAGCVSVNMIHMECSMPETMKNIYKRLGYGLFETIYNKDLCQ